MKFGVARDLVTSAVRTHMGGYGSLFGQYFTAIHDDLYVKALVLDDGRHKALLMTYDLLMHSFELTERLADYAGQEYGIERENVVVSYTHNHAGPAIEGYDPGQSSPEYEAFLFERSRACVDRAFVNILDGTASFGTVSGNWNINRRARVDGKIVNAPNLGGSKDCELNILRFLDGHGECQALLLNYACHPVTLADTLWISSEYPGRLCQLLESRFYGCTALFFQGAGATTRPLVSAAPPGWKRCSFDDVDGMAAAMAISVQTAIDRNRLTPFELKLAGDSFVVHLETQVQPKEFFTGLLEQSGDAPHLQERLRSILDDYDRTPDAVPVHGGIVRLSEDLHIAWLCGEVCYELKQQIAKVFEGTRLIFVGYCDGIAYLPDDKLIGEGGYEVDGSVVEFCLRGRFKRGVTQKLADAYRQVLSRARTGSP